MKKNNIPKQKKDILEEIHSTTNFLAMLDTLEGISFFAKDRKFCLIYANPPFHRRLGQARARGVELILIIAWGWKIDSLGVRANLALEGSAYGPCWCHDDGILENGLWADVLNNLPNG